MSPGVYTLVGMPFVVPGVARFAINQQLEGRPVVNVLDYVIDTTGSSMGRAEAVENQAKDIITQWTNTLFTFCVDDMTFDSVSYVDLDSADGVTGLVTSSDDETLPQSGIGAGAPLPANTAALFTKQAPSARGRRNGRLFMAGLTESTTTSDNGNRIEPANVTTLNAAAATFLANTNNTDGLGTAFESNMVVVHVLTRGASPRPGVPGPPLTGTHSVVQSFTVDPLLATQRRRLRK